LELGLYRNREFNAAERYSLLTHIAALESASLCVLMKS